MWGTTWRKRWSASSPYTLRYQPRLPHNDGICNTLLGLLITARPHVSSPTFHFVRFCLWIICIFFCIFITTIIVIMMLISIVCFITMRQFTYHNVFTPGWLLSVTLVFLNIGIYLCPPCQMWNLIRSLLLLSLTRLCLSLSLTHTCTQVFTISKELVPRILSKIVEAVAEEMCRLMHCVPSFSKNGAMQVWMSHIHTHTSLTSCFHIWTYNRLFYRRAVYVNDISWRWTFWKNTTPEVIFSPAEMLITLYVNEQ